MPRPTKAQRAAIARRRADAVELRLAGADPLAVGRKLAADPTVNTDRVAYPCGYGHELYSRGRPSPDDETLVRSVNRDVAQALEYRITASQDDIEELRALHEARLDRLFMVAYRKAVRDGELPAIDRALRIMERQDRLRGISLPPRVEITGQDGGPIEVDTTADELAALIAITDPAGAGGRE
ncbi:hypothetical protein OG455_27235 [Kitasatospora sp. NBC_01287]|uniref:hypothetical protein n=1 Tax=Kitasatospora sp. NBC_01287 TaxID=2903573 RepID=UPI002251B293|nr:hypothetical protein [Kitasatospora sp. NBC_01287]MCX4749158.1 hypothetical protein [Kitasatospora sp. NBC_01287]